MIKIKFWFMHFWKYNWFVNQTHRQIQYRYPAVVNYKHLPILLYASSILNTGQYSEYNGFNLRQFPSSLKSHLIYSSTNCTGQYWIHWLIGHPISELNGRSAEVLLMEYISQWCLTSAANYQILNVYRCLKGWSCEPITIKIPVWFLHEELSTSLSP